MTIFPHGNGHLPIHGDCRVAPCTFHQVVMTIFPRGDDHLITRLWPSSHVVMIISSRGDDHLLTWWWPFSHVVMSIFTLGDDHLPTWWWLSHHEVISVHGKWLSSHSRPLPTLLHFHRGQLSACAQPLLSLLASVTTFLASNSQLDGHCLIKDPHLILWLTKLTCYSIF